MKYSSQKIITIGFGLMLLFLLLITAVGLSNITALNEKINDIVHIHNAKNTLISHMRNIARERSLSLYRMVLLRDPFDIDAEKIHMSELAGQFLSAREQLNELKMTVDEKEMVEQTLAHVYFSTNIQKQLLAIIDAEAFDEAHRFLMDKAIPEQNRLLAKYDQLLKLQLNMSHNDAIEADNKYQKTLMFVFLFSVSIILIGIVISFFVVKKTSSAERQLREANENLEARVYERTMSLYHSNQELQATIDTLNDTQQQLVQAEKMASLGGLVAGISHEINTPIGVGFTAATYIQEQEQELSKHFAANTITQELFKSFLEQLRESADILVKNINRASELIKNFKRIAVDQSNDDFSIIELHKYIDDVLLSLHPKIKQTRVTITNHCEPELSLYTNPGAIYQVLSNLIVNSLLHSYEQNEIGAIEISAQRKNDYILITHCDHGKGIPDDHLKKIFDPFFTTRRGSGGSGLGLHIVYNLVTTTLKGSINVQSKEGEGCCFLIKLPILN